MSSAQFKFDGLIPSLRADGTDGQLTVGEYKGYISLTVFANNSMALRIPINKFAWGIIRKSMNLVQKIQNGTRFVALNANEYDQNTRKQTFKHSVIFGKTEDGIIYIELKGKDNAPIKFLYKLPAMLTYGADPVSDTVRSSDAFEIWKYSWENDIPGMMRLARLNWVSPGRGGGGRQNNNNNQPSSGSSDNDIY